MFRNYNSMRIVLAAILTIGLLIPLDSFQRNVSADNSAEKQSEQIKKSYSHTPIYFEENRGQFPDHVHFAVRNSGSQMFLTTRAEVVFVLKDETKSAEEDQSTKSEERAVAVFMRPVGANPSAEISGEEELAGKINYFKGNDSRKWQTDVPIFARTQTEEIYPGVSLIWYGSGEKSVEYDFIVAPAANPNQIEWQIDGAQNVSLDAEGNLVIETEYGTLKQQKPVSYQEAENGLRAEVASGYVVEKTTNDAQQTESCFRVKFNVGGYDRTKPLIIDPNVNLSNMAFSTLLGGESTDRGNAIAVDASGNTYITGMTQSLLFPTTPGAFDTANIGDSAFVAKMNAVGTNLIYSTYIDGGGSDEGFGIAVDASGNTYLTGSTTSNNFPVTAANAFDSSFNNGFEAFFVKLNSTGSALIYSTYLGGTSSEQGLDVDIDSSGNAYLTGSTSSADFPTTAGAFDTGLNSTDAFVSKINPSLSGAASLIYSTYLGGTSGEFGIGIAIDSSGAAYITGNTSSSDFPTTTGTFDTVYNSGGDVFVTKLNNSGTAPVYSTYIGGDSFEQGNDIAVDAAGQAYITGITNDGTTVDYPTTSLAFDTTPNGSEDVFVTKLNLTGSSLSYSTYVGGSGLDRCHDIAIDSSGAVYITGTTQDSTTDYPTTANAFDPSQNGGQDIFVSKIIPNFFLPASVQLQYSTFIGSSGFVNESGNGIAVDSSGNIYVTGETGSPATASIPTTFEAFQPNHNGGTTDSFICKFGDYAIAGRVLDSNLVPVSNVAVAMAGAQSGAVFSDLQGYFAFTDTTSFGNFTVTATRAGMAFNPSNFSISGLGSNIYLNFVGVSASPTGFPGGLMRVFPIHNTDESSDYITIAIERVQVYSDNVVTIDYKTASGTAVANEDFIYQQGTLTFLPFESVKTIQVQIINDRISEGHETFSIVLSNPTGGAALSENASAQITINDDDPVRKRKPREPIR